MLDHIKLDQIRSDYGLSAIWKAARLLLSLRRLFAASQRLLRSQLDCDSAAGSSSLWWSWTESIWLTEWLTDTLWRREELQLVLRYRWASDWSLVGTLWAQCWSSSKVLEAEVWTLGLKRPAGVTTESDLAFWVAFAAIVAPPLPHCECLMVRQQMEKDRLRPRSHRTDRTPVDSLVKVESRSSVDASRSRRRAFASVAGRNNNLW